MFCKITGHENGICEEEEVNYFLDQISLRVESFNSLKGYLSQDIIGVLHVASALMEHFIEQSALRSNSLKEILQLRHLLNEGTLCMS